MKNSLCAPGQDVAIVFARAPVPGRVKTRMIPRLGPERACALHLAATGDVADLLDRTLPAAQKWLFWSEAPAALSLNVPLGELRLPSSFGIALQSGLDLGERMGRALERALAGGAARVLLLGSDSPTLPPEYLTRALELLRDSDMVLGPSEDGGFYLIGARSFDRAAFGRTIFDGVVWGGPDVFARTAANIARAGLSLATLPRWYDLDTWRDVERMMTEAVSGPPLPPRLAALLRDD